MTPEAWGFLGIVATGVFGIITLVIQQKRKGNVPSNHSEATSADNSKEESMGNSVDPLERAVSLALDRVTTLLEETTTHLNQVQRELRTTQNELIEKRGEVHTLQERNREYQGKISQLQYELSSMEGQLSACRREIETLRRKLGGNQYDYGSGT